MCDILKKLYYNGDYDSDGVETEDDMSDDESPYNSDSDADMMSVSSEDEEDIIIAEPAGESLPVRIDWELPDLEDKI